MDTKAGVFGVDFVLMLGWTSELIYLEDGKTFCEVGGGDAGSTLA